MKKLYEIIKKMPKAELHVHLEGSVQPETLLRLAERNKIELPADNPEKLREWYNFDNFDRFIDVYMTICRCIKTSDDVYDLAEAFFREQQRQNIIYSEVTWTAYTHLMQHGLSFNAQAEALYAAADYAAAELGVYGMYIFDIPRQVKPAEGLVTARWLAENYNPDYIAAIGLGGPEVGFPPELHAEAFRLTGAAGIPAVPHAGETAGPLSIRSALGLAGTARIGHGVRAVEDSALIDELKDRGIVLEVSLSSNICLNIFPDIAHHSLPILVDAGVKVTINSDDPVLFNTDLCSEYRKIAETFGFGIPEFRIFNETAVDSALCNDEMRTSVLERFESGWNGLIR